MTEIGLRICFFSRIERLFFCFDSGQILATGAKYLPEIQTLIFQAVMTEIGLRMGTELP